jgi:hypothetical protein
MDGSDVVTENFEPFAIAADDKQLQDLRPLRPSFGALLMDAELVTREQLYQALAEGTRTGERLGEVLIRHGLTSEHEVARILSEQYRLPLLEAHAVAADPAGSHVLPPTEARRLEACVVGFEGDVPVAALADPNEARFNSLRETLGEQTRFAIVTASTLNQLLGGAPTEDLVEELSTAAASADAAETAASAAADQALEVAEAPIEVLSGDDGDPHPDEAVAPAHEAIADPAPAPVEMFEPADTSQVNEPHADPDAILAEFDGVTAKLQDSVETFKSLRFRLAHVVETPVGAFRELDLCQKELDAERAARGQDREKMRQLEEQLTERTQLLAEMKAKLDDFMSGLELRI